MYIVWLGYLTTGRSTLVEMICVDTLAVLTNFEIAELLHNRTIATIISAAMQTARVL